MDAFYASLLFMAFILTLPFAAMIIIAYIVEKGDK